MNLFYQVQSLWFFLLYYLTLYSYVAIIIDANTFPKMFDKKKKNIQKHIHSLQVISLIVIVHAEKALSRSGSMSSTLC